MGSGNLTRDVNAHGDAQSPTQSYVGETSVDDFSRILRWKQHDHGDYAGAEQDQDKRPEELGEEFRGQTRF